MLDPYLSGHDFMTVFALDIVSSRVNLDVVAQHAGRLVGLAADMALIGTGVCKKN